MTETTDPVENQPDDFQVAVQAVTRAVRAINDGTRGGDGGEFITHLLAAVAANLGSSYAVTRARPGSWEADKVTELLHSTVGPNDEYLIGHRTEPVELVVNADNELDDLGMAESYEASADYIGRRLFGDHYSPVIKQDSNGVTYTLQRAGLTLDELEQMDAIDELLYDLADADRAEFQQRFTATVLAEFEQLQQESPQRYPADLTVSVRFTDDYDNLTDAWSEDVTSRLYEHARLNTRLPGSDLRYRDLPAHRPGRAALSAGHWPHLRIPQLAHYGAPTTTQEN